MHAEPSQPGAPDSPADEALAHVRPLAIGDILDLALRLYRRNFKALFLAMLGLQIPIFLVQKIPEVVTSRIFPGGADPELLMLLPPDEMIAGFAVVGGVNIVAMVLLTVLAAFASGALVHGGERAWRGEAATTAGCYAGLKKRLPALAGTQLLVMLLLLLGIFAAALPGGILIGIGGASASIAPIVLGTLVAVVGILVVAIALYLRWFLAVPVVMLDGLSGMAALSRSSQLMSGSIGPGFLDRVKVRASIILLVVFFIVIIPSLMIGIPKLVLAASYSSVDAMDIGAVPLLYRLPIESAELLLAALLTPFSVMTILLVYLDLRVRKEGYDLELQAQALGTPAEHAAAPVLARAIPDGAAGPPS